MMLVKDSKDVLIKKISNQTVMNQLVNTIYVDDSIGNIDITSTQKEKNLIRSTTKKIDYKLKSHRIIVKKRSDESDIIISDLPYSDTIKRDKSICSCISSDFNKVFISELNSFKNIERGSFNFSKYNFFKKIFLSNRIDKLVDYILNFGKGCSWVIIPTSLFNTIRKSDRFREYKIESESIIYKIGNFDNLSVYINPNETESVAYFGNYDSITILINRNIKIDKVNNLGMTSTLVIDYLFLESGVSKSLLVY